MGLAIQCGLSGTGLVLTRLEAEDLASPFSVVLSWAVLQVRV